jgi:uncharacterized membrane protein HdeD (DUF308 family)
MPTGLFDINVSEARRYWGWFIALGIALVVLGMIVLGSPIAMTVKLVFLWGVLMLVAGVFEIIAAFGTPTWGGLFFHLFSGAVDVFLGIVMIGEPEAASIWLTLVLGLMFIMNGAMRIAFSAGSHHPNWGAGVFSGLVTALLGIIICVRWPMSGLIFIGIAVAVELLLHGWMWIMLGLALSTVPRPQTPASTTPAT